MPTNDYTPWYNWVIANVVVPIDNCLATLLNNIISFWDIVKYHFTPSEDHPYGNPFPSKDHPHESPFSKTFLLIIPIVAINCLLNKYERERAKEEESDQYLFTQLYNKLYDEDERKTHLHLYGVAYYYNDSVHWLIRKFRFLKGYFFGGKGFEEARIALTTSSLVKLRAQLLTEMVDLCNKREPDTWYVKDKDHNPKISMTEKVFDKKLGEAFKKAQDEQSENENQRLARKIKEAGSQLDKYKNDYQYQLITELLSFSERESIQLNKKTQKKSDTPQVREEADELRYKWWLDSLKEILEELKKGKISFTYEDKEKLFTFFEKSEDQESKAACNRLAYIQALCDIKKREITELKKQFHRGWMSAAGSFIEDHLIRDIATASFVFWIGYFLALCATGSAPIAVIVATLYLFLIWTSKLYNYFGRSNAREKSKEEIKEKLISEQLHSEELESLTLDEEIKKLNYLLEFKSVRAQMLERKETWIYVDSILEGFVRGSFAPFFILWFSTTMAGWAASYFFGIAVLINPFVSAILTTAVLFLAIGYGIYKAVNYYKETRRDIDRLREKFHNEKVEQYDRVIDKLCDYIEAQLNDSSADLQKPFKIKIQEEKRKKLKNKVYLLLSLGQSNQIFDELKESFKKIIGEQLNEEEKEKLNTLSDHEFERLKSIKLNPEQQPKQSKISFWLKVKLAFIFLTAAGSGILFLKLLAMGVALAWCPAAYIGIAVVGLLVVGGLLYGAWDVWKNYRLLDEQSKEKTSVLSHWADKVSLDPNREEADSKEQNLDTQASAELSTSTNEFATQEIASTLNQPDALLVGNLYPDLSKDKNYNNLSVNAMINGGFLSKQSKKIEEEIQQNTETINCVM